MLCTQPGKAINIDLGNIIHKMAEDDCPNHVNNCTTTASNPQTPIKLVSFNVQLLIGDHISNVLLAFIINFNVCHLALLSGSLCLLYAH